MVTTQTYHFDFVIPLIGLNLVTGISATILNALVILTIWKTPPLQTPSRILLSSLALTDLLAGAVVQPVFIAYCISALMNWCQAFVFIHALVVRLGYSLTAISMTTLAAIALDRFLAIATKQNYRIIVTKKRCLIAVIFLWLAPGSAMIIGLQFKTYEDNDTTILMSIMILFLVIIITLYGLSFYLMKKMFTSIAHSVIHNTTDQTAPGFNIWKYKRFLVTMVIILGQVLLSYTPLLCVYSSLGLNAVLNKPALLHFGEFFILLISTLNPILYLWRMKGLRHALNQILFHS
ncbi:histamine H2 receptor-like [Actinia tenebrosa]|uniref:Histamine H2 receptor-like n=1 Tax=Actinia tenebrosa TaxID=6105 RepID=A0A6P8IW00_ACTTE|nr:histamine H2 receptor-like [Actinia tenebrosa]